MLLLVQDVSMLAVVNSRPGQTIRARYGRAGQGRVGWGRALTKELNFKACRDVACKACATSAHGKLHVNIQKFEAFQQ